MSEKDLKIILEFQNIIKTINSEICKNRGINYYFSIEQILIHNSPSELYSVLKHCSPTYREICDNPQYNVIMCLLDDYVYKVYKYYDSLLFTGQNKFDQYVAFSKGEPAGNKLYTREDLEMDLHNISNTIGLLNEAIRLWYEVYENKLIIAKFSDGEIQEFKIKEGELAHLFGVIWSSLKNNEQLKKMGIEIPDTQLSPEEKYEILLKITQLYDNGNILQYEEDRLRKMLDTDYVYKVAKIDKKFDFYRKDESLLPYPKINVRTKAFIDYRPLDRLSLLLDFKQGVKIIKKDTDDVKNTILLSKNSFSDNFNWTGIVSTRDFNTNNNYMRSLLINSPGEYKKYIEKLTQPDGEGGFLAKESITTEIALESVSGGGGGEVRIFTDEEQLAFIDEILADFKSISFKNIIDYYKDLISKYGKKL